MIHYYEGTVFNVEAQALVNTVNCSGVMGAGIALEFMLRFPKMFDDYEKKCKTKQIIIGRVDYFKYESGDIIVNFPTKWHFKYPSKMIWIEQGLQNFTQTYKQQNIKSVAFPKLGTSNGGLKWIEVKSIMEKYLSNLDIDVYICLDTIKEAEGLEKKMLDIFNNTSVEHLSTIVKLNTKQIENIRMKKPYNRFWKIGDTESIGIKTYKTIFKSFYNITVNNDYIPKQVTIFDL